MRKKKSIVWKIIWVVLAVALIIIAIYGGTHGWFNIIFNINNNVQIPSNPEKQETSYWVSLGMNPSMICVGDTATGEIRSNMPNAYCRIFYNAGTGDNVLMDVQLDSNGHFSQSQAINSVGQVSFKAVCMLNEKFRISNTVTLTSSMCSQATCSETDGGNKPFIGGITTTKLGSMHDTCQNSNTLLEFYCDNNAQKSTTVNCQYGCKSDSNGDYCKSSYECSDSDGGKDYLTWGNCQDSYHQLGYTDNCNNNVLTEYYCDSNNICQSESYNCPAGTICSNGKCISNGQMPCELIGRPSSQAMCNQGFCDSGTCTFIPATLVAPARCGCN